MKNKKVTYLLLVLSIALWGFIGWKVYNAFNYNQPEIPMVKKEVIMADKDSITLLLNYRDPFLGKYSSGSIPKDTLPVKKKTIVAIPPQKPEPTSPKMNYKGTMHVGNIIMVVLQKDDGKVLTIKVGDVIDGYKLTKIDDNKIILIKDRKKYEIPIQ